MDWKVLEVGVGVCDSLLAQREQVELLSEGLPLSAAHPCPRLRGALHAFHQEPGGQGQLCQQDKCR